MLDIKVPAIQNITTEEGLQSALANQWPKYLAYVLSFVTVLIMWAGHHTVVAYMVRTNWIFFLLNGLYLMGVAVLPFPTALLSEYIGHPGGDTAAAVYSATFLFISLLFNGLFWYAAADYRLLDPAVTPQEIRHQRRRNLVGPVFYVLGLLLSLAHLGGASLAIYAVLAVFYLVPRSLVRRWLGG